MDWINRTNSQEFKEEQKAGADVKRTKSGSATIGGTSITGGFPMSTANFNNPLSNISNPLASDYNPLAAMNPLGVMAGTTKKPISTTSNI